MATRKSVAAVAPPPEEEEVEEEEPEEPVTPPPYVPVHVPKNPLLFPPRGPSRPHMRQVLSEPELTRRFLALPEHNQDYQADKLDEPTKDYHQGAKSHDDYRQGLSSLLKGLEKQTTKKKEKERHRQVSENAANEMKRAHELFLENGRVAKEKPAWTYTDHADFMEQPQLYEQGESKICSRNNLLTGIFDVPHPDYKPPHSECNVYGGWNYFDTNLRNERLYEFRDKAWQKTPMGPNEIKFKERLDRSIERMTAATHKDALDKTTGSVKKKKLFETARGHSCLKREGPPWTTQDFSTHTYFGEYTAYKPGDNKYETGIPKYVVQAERGMSYKTNIIVGDEQQKSFWKGAPGTLSGTNRRHTMAQELLHRNTRGCAELKPASPTLKRNVLLRGTGTLSFAHFKDALKPPMYERFSPGDRMAPPDAA